VTGRLGLPRAEAAVGHPHDPLQLPALQVILHLADKKGLPSAPRPAPHRDGDPFFGHRHPNQHLGQVRAVIRPEGLAPPAERRLTRTARRVLSSDGQRPTLQPRSSMINVPRRLISYTASQPDRTVPFLRLVTLAALPATFLLAGCSTFGPSVSISSPKPSRPSAPTTPVTAIHIVIGAARGELTAAAGRLACSSGDRSFTLSGPVASDSVTLTLSGLQPNQSLTFPPPSGSFADSLTLVASGPELPRQTFYAGPLSGAIQGNGTLAVARSGSSGHFRLALTSSLNSGIDTLGAIAAGTWSCSG